MRGRRHYTEDGHAIVLLDNAVYFIPRDDRGLSASQVREYQERALRNDHPRGLVVHDTLIIDDFSVDANARSSFTVPPLSEELRSSLLKLTADLPPIRDWRKA